MNAVPLSRPAPCGAALSLGLQRRGMGLPIWAPIPRPLGGWPDDALGGVLRLG